MVQSKQLTVIHVRQLYRGNTMKSRSKVWVK